ncbi:MAG: nuclear transport factor 2 family protein [Niabella sp.]
MLMKKWMVITCIVLLPAMFANAQSKSEKQVAAAVATLVKAMEDGDVAALNKIAHKKLTYGHSGGNVQNKAQFVESFATGATDFVKINISDQSITVFDKTAVVRHTLEADTNDNKKPGHIKLKIMTIWQKKGGVWKMIARQAVKPSV